jgi:hypothetical protein
MIVVSPFEPDEVAYKIEALYETTSPRAHEDETRALPPAFVDVTGPKGRLQKLRFTWAIEGSLPSIWRARVLCGALNRQPRMTGERPAEELRCLLHEDPRRPALQVSTSGLQASEARKFVVARLTRLAQDPIDRDVINIERMRQARELVDELQAPLSLVSLLARALPAWGLNPSGRVDMRTSLNLDGLASVAAVTAMARGLASRLVDSPPSQPPAASVPPGAPDPSKSPAEAGSGPTTSGER